jgi:hypothetical protein
MDATDISQMPGPRQNQPTSGTYGEGASNDRLGQAMKQAEQSAQKGPEGPSRSISPLPVAPRTTPPAGAGGLPAGLFGPTQRPDTPVNTPLQAPPSNPVAEAPSNRMARMHLLRQMAEAPNVSAATKRWAQKAYQEYLRG